MNRSMIAAAMMSVATLAGAPAQAQIFWQSPVFPSAPIIPGEPGVGVPLPGANTAEERANLAWQMRAGLNVAALQCQFDRTLGIKDNYAGVLTNHRVELSGVYAALGSYFQRVAGSAKAGQQGLDRYGTRTYSSFSTVGAQLAFCQTASLIAHEAQFAPRGQFTDFAVARLRQLRGSLAGGQEQFFRPIRVGAIPALDLNPKCWDRRGRYKNCPMVVL